MEKSRIEKQFEFCREIDKEKFIGRQTYLTDRNSKENDAEHAWHMALMAVLLSEYSNEPIDVLKTVTMLLLHDLVEIDAGDTYAYDEEAKKTQKQRELAAADRIFGLLPEDQQEKLRGLWEEFEAESTPEARFARTLDNIQPTMLNAPTIMKAMFGPKLWTSMLPMGAVAEGMVNSCISPRGWLMGSALVSVRGDILLF